MIEYSFTENRKIQEAYEGMVVKEAVAQSSWTDTEHKTLDDISFEKIAAIAAANSIVDYYFVNAIRLSKPEMTGRNTVQFYLTFYDAKALDEKGQYDSRSFQKQDSNGHFVNRDGYDDALIVWNVHGVSSINEVFDIAKRVYDDGRIWVVPLYNDYGTDGHSEQIKEPDALRTEFFKGLASSLINHVIVGKKNENMFHDMQLAAGKYEFKAGKYFFEFEVKQNIPVYHDGLSYYLKPYLKNIGSSYRKYRTPELPA